MRPAGYSSDENDDEDDYYSRAYEERKIQEPTEAEKRIAKINFLTRYATNGYTEGVIEILKEGYDINSRLNDDWNLLLLSTASGNADLSIELIKRGADVNVERDGLTPLMAAAGCPVTTSSHDSTYKIVEYLIKHGADPTKKNRKRMNALMFAANVGNEKAVKLLLEYVDKNDEDNQGWTALFWAVNGHSLPVVQILIEAGLHHNKYDVRRFKAIDYAKQNGYNDISDYLPDPERNKNAHLVHNSHYIFSEEIISLNFQRDVYLMLVGMRCERLVEIFMNTNMDLFHFLTLTPNDLINLGIKRPYQQNRILGGLYRFHKHCYQRKSVPFVPKTKDYTSTDFALGIMSAARHIVTVTAGLRYLRINFNNWNADPDLLEQLDKIQEFVVAIEGMVKKLQVVAKKWDEENEPVDLITSKVKKKHWNWIYWLPVFSFGSIIAYRYISHNV